MPVRVGINGFGRIGRNFLRAVLEADADVEIVAANDLAPTATNAHLLKYDSTFGVLADEVKVSEDTIAVGPHSFKVFAEKDPASIPWGDLGADVVIESTGKFTNGEKARGSPGIRGQNGHHLCPWEQCRRHLRRRCQRRQLRPACA